MHIFYIARKYDLAAYCLLCIDQHRGQQVGRHAGNIAVAILDREYDHNAELLRPLYLHKLKMVGFDMNFAVRKEHRSMSDPESQFGVLQALQPRGGPLLGGRSGFAAEEQRKIQILPERHYTVGKMNHGLLFDFKFSETR